MKRFVSIAVVFMLFLSIFFTFTAGMQGVSAQRTEVKRTLIDASSLWIDPPTTVLNLSEVEIGHKFNLTVWVNLTEASFTWQIMLLFDSAYLQVTRAGYTGGSTSMFFAGHATIPVTPIITDGSVNIGESLLGMDSRPPDSGSLCWVEFALQNKSPASLIIDFQETETFFLNGDLNDISTPDIRTASVDLLGGTQPPSGDNTMWVEPSALDFYTDTIHLHDKFNVTIWVNVTVSCFTWQITLLFNSSHLQVTRVGYTMGTTSQFFAGHSTLPVSPLITDESAQTGESLIGSDEREAGVGSLCWVEFEIMVEPPENDVLSSVLDITNTDTFLLNGNLEEVPTTRFNAAYSYHSVQQGVHDVAIIRVDTSPIEVVAGEIVHINVTAINGGTVPETFDVTCYYDSSVIGTMNVALSPNENRTLSFSWNTAGILANTYTMSARASEVPGESDTVDNTFVDDQVIVTTTVPPEPYVVLVKFTPQTLNLNSKGKWITAHIKLSGQYDARDIDTYTIRLNSTIVAQPTHGSHTGSDVLEVKFGRSAVIGYIQSIQGVSLADVVLTITGQFRDGTWFQSFGALRPKIHGDANSDGRVDMKDISLVATKFGKTNYDTNEDEKITMRDIAVYAKQRSANLAAVTEDFCTISGLNSCDIDQDGMIGAKDIAITVQNFFKKNA